MAPAKKQAAEEPAEQTAAPKGGKRVADNLAQGYVHEIEGLEARKRALGDVSDAEPDVKRLADNLDRRIGEVTTAIGGDGALGEFRKKFGKVTADGKPIERAVPDDDGVETR